MMEISWTNYVKNADVLSVVKEERNIVHTMKRSNDKWIGHILRRNCCRKHVMEGKIKGRERLGRGRMWLQNGRKEWRRYWNLKDKQYIIMWGTCFGSGYGPVARQATTLTNHYITEILFHASFYSH
jgi:hypothetical protein